ncbi:hypothetical protein [Krasilnikovia sp. MM14-A1259]|uniref:hypothetical protein n=1 Tax=Krasilnikovia sp. MM14-A1259 TaxID=3373539 RepID=UPI00380E3FE0
MTRPLRFDSATLLDDLAAARDERDQALLCLRRLVAYARTQVRPCPYRLADLAEAAGMSISGVRICYRPADVAYVRTIAHLDRKAPE